MEQAQRDRQTQREELGALKAAYHRVARRLMEAESTLVRVRVDRQHLDERGRILDQEEDDFFTMKPGL